MSYLSSFRPRSHRPSKKYIFSGLILACLTFGSVFIIGSPLYRLSEIIWSEESRMGKWREDFRKTFEEKSTLVDRVRELESERDKLKLELLEMQAINLAEESYRIDMSGGESKADDLEARIIRRPPDSPFDTLLVDVGSKMGVVAGMRAYYGGTLVGVVSEVMPELSRIELLTSPGRSFKAIVGASLHEASAVGMGGGFYKIEIPRDIVINIGDVVRDVDREAYLMGVVDHIDSPETGTLQSVYVGLPFPFFNAEWLTLRKTEI